MAHNKDSTIHQMSEMHTGLDTNDSENIDLKNTQESSIPNTQTIETDQFEKRNEQQMSQADSETSQNYADDDNGDSNHNTTEEENEAGEKEDGDDDDDGAALVHNVKEIAFVLNVKDFAYDVSDPKHFGIYDEFSSDEDYDEDEDKDEVYGGQIYYNEYGEAYFKTENTDHSLLKGRESVDTDADTVDCNSHLNINTENNDNHDILHAIALYPFVPENSNELSLVPDQILIINYECGDGWLVAHDPVSGQTGLVPSEYIRMINVDESNMDTPEYEEFAEDVKDAHRFMPEILGDDNGDLTTENFKKLEI